MSTLGNYLLQRWGNPDATVTVDQVQALRAGSESSPLTWLVRGGLMGGVVLIVALILFIRSRRTKSPAA
jgi:hypothetical protein